jgi:hypothetical protein
VTVLGSGLGGVRNIRMTGYTLAGPRRAEIVACRVEIDGFGGIEERAISFLEPYGLATVQALVELLNRKLRQVSV